MNNKDKINTINWVDFQLEYDSGIATRKLLPKYNASWTLLTRAIKLGLFKSRTMSEANRMYNKLNPGKRKHSEKTKKLISEKRKSYLKENPDKIPYLLNHKHKRQFYSEIYFEECFRGIKMEKEHRIGLYSLDFANLEKKIDFEVDGDQHFVDKRIIEHDRERNNYLSLLGWTVIRVRWSEFQKLTPEEKVKIVQSIIKFENPNAKCVLFILPNTNPDMVAYFERTHNSTCKCGQEKDRQSIMCRICRNIEKTGHVKIEKSQLHYLIWNEPLNKISKKFKIARKTLNKWIISYSLSKPTKFYFQKLNAGLITDYQI